ncbi:hypothetical protein AEAC466_19185 [Asticcacaulis sp. AC466]|uniref:hypothetical protein n=1 Tax=Asticcacaulis sp. AC466 TaxID=1282362 RepID=UPI0003C3FC01|nr:hypothetical protein [Asticcacaulis sp. AC466]ESQ82044.1 hypothetical protein AEAC466_19185 [Asticcacaulis sp. AC466]
MNFEIKVKGVLKDKLKTAVGPNGEFGIAFIKSHGSTDYKTYFYIDENTQFFFGTREYLTEDEVWHISFTSASYELDGGHISVFPPQCGKMIKSNLEWAVTKRFLDGLDLERPDNSLKLEYDFFYKFVK